MSLPPPPALFAAISPIYLTQHNDPELFLRAFHITNLCADCPKNSWPAARVKHAVDFTFDCLRMLSYVSLLLFNDLSWFERYPSGVLPNGVFFNGTFPQNDSYPACIYPCGITPNGTFTTSQPPQNIFDLAKQEELTNSLLSHYHREFPYYEFFFPTPSATIVAASLHLNLYPCNITPWGDFLDFPNQHPYGEKWGSFKDYYGYREKLDDLEDYQYEEILSTWHQSSHYGEDLWLPSFQYDWFFSGDLISEITFKSQRPDNWTLINYMLDNQSFPDIYPWDIYPNGTFRKCPDNFSQPYGNFDHFPYRDFFGGNFSYEAKFVGQLYELYGKYTRSATAGVTILTSYWAFNSLAQLILVSPKSKSPLIRKLRILSLCVASSTFLASIVDLSWNIKWLINTKESSALLGISALAVVYDSVYLTREIVSFTSPWVRKKVHQIAKKATKITGITRKGTMLQIDSTYQKSLQNTRITASLLQVLLTGCMALTIISQYVFSDLQSDYHNLYPTQAIILAIFTGIIACLFLFFAYFSHRKH